MSALDVAGAIGAGALFLACIVTAPLALCALFTAGGDR